VPDRSRAFFKSSRAWQWIKHLVLADYLKPWSFKVGSTAAEIYVVDAFAGAGTYEIPGSQKTDGSPVIAARRAAEYRSERPGKSMHVICVERNDENFTDLEKRMRGWVADGLVTLHHGSFSRYATRVAAQIGTSPALVLLDPIGLKAIDASTCRVLLDRQGKTDAFIIVDFSIVHRTAGQLLPDGSPNPDIAVAAKNAKNIDAFFDGDTTWRNIAKQRLTPYAREWAYLDLYFKRVLVPRYRYRSAYPVRPYFTNAEKAPEYWLVHAGDFIDAAFLMNDEIAKVERELYRRTFETDGTIEGLADAEYDLRVERVMERLEAETLRIVGAAGERGITFGALEAQLLPTFFGRVKRAAFNKKTKELVRHERLLREKEWWRAAWDPQERITVPPEVEPRSRPKSRTQETAD
jgi:three-Cys-motif partner protein